jgi:hypothetical protein
LTLPAQDFYMTWHTLGGSPRPGKQATRSSSIGQWELTRAHASTNSPAQQKPFNAGVGNHMVTLRSSFLVSATLLYCLTGLGQGQQAPVSVSARAIPDDNLAYPVLVTLGDNSSASGFFLNDGHAVYLVTARHVLYKNKPPQQIAPNQDPWELRSGTGTLVSYSKDPADSTQNLFALDLSVLESAGNMKHHPIQDVAVIKVMTESGSGGVPKDGESVIGQVVPGVTIKQLSKLGVLDVNITNIKTFSQVLTGNDVMVFGYPSSIGLVNVPQIDYQRPLLRKGIVAGTNPAKRSVILDCPVYFGNSAGPVLELDRQAFGTALNLIGVAIEYIPFNQTPGSETVAILTNSGYSVVAPMDFVLDLLK